MTRLLSAGLLTLVGILGLVLVTSALSVVGFDGHARTEAMIADERSQAVMIDQQLIPVTNAVAEVSVESDSPVFVGTANGVDARSYLTGTAHDEVTKIKLPGKIEHRFVAGGESLQTAPGSRDWWIAQETGTSPKVRLGLDSNPQMVVVAAPEGDLADAKITVTVDTPGVVPLALIGLAFTVLAFAAAVWLFLSWKHDQPKVAVGRRRGAVEQDAEVPGTQVPEGEEPGGTSAADGEPDAQVPEGEKPGGTSADVKKTAEGAR